MFFGVCRWDALGSSQQEVKAEPQSNGIKEEVKEEEEEEGRIWHVQAHARNAITAMKVDPVDGSGVSRRMKTPRKDMPWVFEADDDVRFL